MLHAIDESYETSSVGSQRNFLSDRLLEQQLSMTAPLQSVTLIERVNELNKQCDWLLKQGTLEKRPDTHGRYCWGTGVKRAVFFQGKDYAPVDLFQVVGEPQWGVIYAIRTGPGDYNHRLVTSRALGGACPLDRKVAGGRVWDLTTYTTIERHNVIKMPATKFVTLVGRSIPNAPVIPTPEEEDFFAALGVPCWLPDQRTVHRLIQFVRRTRWLPASAYRNPPTGKERGRGICASLERRYNQHRTGQADGADQHSGELVCLPASDLPAGPLHYPKDDQEVTDRYDGLSS